MEELGQDSALANGTPNDAEHYRIDGKQPFHLNIFPLACLSQMILTGGDLKTTGPWFSDKVNKILESEKTKYLGHWEVLNTHLTTIDKGELEFQKSQTVLTPESGKLLKARFKGFNDDFARTSALHQKLCVIDPRLRVQMQQEVKQVFIPRYERFYYKYKKYKFSKKKQEDYTKYNPQVIEEEISKLYTDPVQRGGLEE